MKRIAAAIMEKPAFLFSTKFPFSVKRLLFILAILLLFSAEILRIYFLMPFPGSQINDTVSYAYWLDRLVIWIRIIVLLFAYFALVSVFRKGRTWEKVVLPLILVSYAIVFFAFNFRFPADKIFYQPVSKNFATIPAVHP